jgi:NADPH-dependent F420 reductase
MLKQTHTIAILGGTGAEGSGLGLRWAHAGHRVIIGSRDVEKAKHSATALNATLGGERITGAALDAAAAACDIAVLTVPYAAQLATVTALHAPLQGKLLIDVTVPLIPPKVSLVQLPPSGSCVVAVQAALGDGVRVVSAFQNVSAHKLKNLDHVIQCDVLVCGNDKAARAVVIALAADAGLRGIDAGPLANSAVAESLTSVLIFINRIYKVPDAGIAITGIG